jgi:hypothetical protein
MDKAGMAGLLSSREGDSMKKREAIRILQARNEKRMKQLFGPKFVEALVMAIDALERQRDMKKVGALGGKALFRKVGRKEMIRRGKLGGRPKRKAA